MPETLTDILAAARESYLTEGEGAEPADRERIRLETMGTLAAIPARDREAWETGRLIAETPGYWRVRSMIETQKGWETVATDGDRIRVGHGPTLLAALTSLLAQLDPTR